MPGGGDWPYGIDTGDGALGKGDVMAAGFAGLMRAGVLRWGRAAGASFHPPLSRLGGDASGGAEIIVQRAGDGWRRDGL